VRLRGQLHGTCRQWAEDGRLLGSFDFERGKGTFMEWFPNGQKKIEFSMAAGMSHGLTEVFDLHGNSVLRQWYLKGRKVSKKEFNGTIPRADP
jgi:antitoxin component YwqK of YwqJK toxin-antitoxin module